MVFKSFSRDGRVALFHISKSKMEQHKLPVLLIMYYSFEFQYPHYINKIWAFLRRWHFNLKFILPTFEYLWYSSWRCTTLVSLTSLPNRLRNSNIDKLKLLTCRPVPVFQLCPLVQVVQEDQARQALPTNEWNLIIYR